MRIAVNGWFLDRSGTGSGQYLNSLLRAMPGVATEHEFLVVTPPGSPERPVPELRIEYHSLGASFWRSNLGKVLFEQIAFPRICRRWDADLAHVPYWGSPLSPTVPTVVTVHDLIPMLLPAYRGGVRVRFYTSLVAAAAGQADLVLTDSLASKRDIEQHLGLPPERVRCVYLAPGQHLSPEPQPDDAAIRKNYGLPQRYVLYLAGHDVRKNVENLVAAFADIVKVDADVTLAIGGKLPERDEPPFYDPRPLVAALSIEGDVRFLGQVAEAHKPALLRGAACAVFASRYEGFGLPALEALACGAPLVTSDASSLPELVGDAAFTVDPDDVETLAGAIVACLVDRGLAAELRRRGPEQAARFTWARAAQETVAAYEEVAGCAS